MILTSPSFDLTAVFSRLSFVPRPLKHPEEGGDVLGEEEEEELRIVLILSRLRKRSSASVPNTGSRLGTLHWCCCGSDVDQCLNQQLEFGFYPQT